MARRVWFLLVALAAAAAGCVSSGEVEVGDPVGEAPVLSSTINSSTSTTTEVTTTTTEAITTTEAPDPILLLLETMTVEQRAGQLLMPVLFGTDAEVVSSAEAAANQRLAAVDSIAAAIQTYNLGGILYLGNNINGADQLSALSAGIQAAARDVIPGVGALIAVDQEGGRVNRITDGVEVFPSARALSGDADAVQAAAEATGAGLAAQGINVVLAPVADLTSGNSGVIGNRSYSDDPEVAAEMVAAAVSGLQSSGVAAGVKHWPGHGATTLDSHSQLPVINVDDETWRGRERVPFAAAVESGVAIVMVGHLALPLLDPEGRPATVSPVLVDELLRGDLGFEGVVMTDALDMGAVRDQDRAGLVVDSMLAGVDVLLATPDVAVAHAAIVDAVKSGTISEDALDDAVERVLRLKARLGLLDLS